MLRKLIRKIINGIKSRKGKALILVIVVTSGGVYLYKQIKQQYSEKNSDSNECSSSSVAVDKKFFTRLLKILKICFPGVYCPETGLLLLLTFLLWSRTVLSIHLADITGKNAQFLVQRDLSNIFTGVLSFAAIGIPAAIVNSGLRYTTSQLALRFRMRLTDYILSDYLRGVNFYKATNLGDGKIDNADQRITTDINNFSQSVSGLYATIFKPVLDTILYSWKLSIENGPFTPVIMYAYYLLNALLKRYVLPSFAKYTALESQLEGDYRTAHQRMITYSEEISFFDGSERERNIIQTIFHHLYEHSWHFATVRGLVMIFDNFLVKYCASIVGYVVMCIPLFTNQSYLEKSEAELTRDYVRSRALLVNLGMAVAQLVVLSNKVTSLAGITSRVSELIEMIENIEQVGTLPFPIVDDPTDSSSPSFNSDGEPTKEYEGFNLDMTDKWLRSWYERGELLRDKSELSLFQKQATSEKSNAPIERFQIGSKIFSSVESLEEYVKSIQSNDPLRQPVSSPFSSNSVTSSGGTVVIGDYIKFSHVDIVSPEGRLLVHDLNFEMKQGMNVMVTGPNGCGKSSLFRILGELWPLSSGLMIKPRKEDLLFLPQKPYCVLGTLRDQIIYPHSQADMQRNGVTDADLKVLLDIVDPSRTILREWELDEVKDWLKTFSGGQKQRVAMARLFYHRPRYAILDECTSAVSDDAEHIIYMTCAKLRITLFTVSHRPQLRLYHSFQLRFDGKGGWQLTQISPDNNKTKLKEDILSLEPQA